MNPFIKDNYCCKDCGESFSEHSLLILHKKSHVVEQNLESKLAKNKLSRKANSKTCISSYSKQNLYQCEVCEKVFNKKYVLKTHLRIHTGEKPFLCKICESAFPRALDLKNSLAKTYWRKTISL